MKTLTAIIGTASLAVLLAGAVGCEDNRTCACKGYGYPEFEAGDTVTINKRGNNCYNYTRNGSWGVFKGKDGNQAIIDFKKISDSNILGVKNICPEHLELYEEPVQQQNNPQENNSQSNTAAQVPVNPVAQPSNTEQTNNSSTRPASLDERIEVAAGNASVNAPQPVAVAQPVVAQPVEVIKYKKTSINQIVQNREKYNAQRVSVLGIPISCRNDGSYFSVIIEDDNTLLLAWANTKSNYFAVDTCTVIDAAMKKNAKIMLDGMYTIKKQLEVEYMEAVKVKISPGNEKFDF